MNGLRVFCFSTILLTAFVAGDNLPFRQGRTYSSNFRLFPPIPNALRGFGSSSISKSSSSIINGHPETITKTQVSGSASANANAQINEGFGLNGAFQTNGFFGANRGGLSGDVNNNNNNNGIFNDKVEGKNQDSCQNKEQTQQQKQSGFQTNNGGQNKAENNFLEGGFGQNCNCICQGIKPFEKTDTNNKSNADSNAGINIIDTRFGSNGIHESGTFEKGPSRGISSSSSAQSFPDGSGSFEVSATKITT
ncbi:uncharacterized protein DDB_G0283357-like [Leptopilina boulardi]|uniref:uncharacterized protein DDB_G0283357-like n=1 Tax=Leptopilina boulardi TaxID=63433 RepID=UPI0021F5255B|nr:uncharacterized protein DDB_G0283357-like [Leptopilina boulardi]